MHPLQTNNLLQKNNLHTVDSEEQITLLIEQQDEGNFQASNHNEFLPLPKQLVQIILEYFDDDELSDLAHNPIGVTFLQEAYSLSTINKWKVKTLATLAYYEVSQYNDKLIKKELMKLWINIIIGTLIIIGSCVIAISYLAPDMVMVAPLMSGAVILPLYGFCSFAYYNHHSSWIKSIISTSIVAKLPTILQPSQWILESINADKKTLGFVKGELHQIKRENNTQALIKFGLFQVSVDTEAVEEKSQRSIPCFLKCPCSPD